MPKFQFSHIALNDEQFVTLLIEGRDPLPANDGNPNFAKIIETVPRLIESQKAGELTDDDLDAFAVLFSPAEAVKRGFQRLSERVTVDGGVVRLDGDAVEDGLTKQILRHIEEGEDFAPLVNFMEKIAMNPNSHSREQAWLWLNNHEFTLTPDGDVVAYKGVYADGSGGYRSGHEGHAFVNDVEFVDEYIPNAVGDTVWMPRQEVAHDPSQSCHYGLHVGTYNYAQSYARGCMLRVIVHPRDIVSVPNDGGGGKIRVCRYVVNEIITAQDAGAVYRAPVDVGFEDDDEVEYDCEECEDTGCPDCDPSLMEDEIEAEDTLARRPGVTFRS